jgi:hypothetical protein
MSPAPTAHVTSGRHAGPESAAGAEPAAGPELADPELAAHREPAARLERERGPMPVAHFDRKWSSPTPPDA